MSLATEALSPLRKLRIVAVMEFAKAIAVLVAGAGLLGADAGAFEVAVRGLFASVAIDPTQGFAASVLGMVQDADRHHALMASAVGAYAAARFAEAGGLWYGRNWARWLGLVSAGLYVPFEVAYLVHQPGATAAALLGLNLLVLWLLWPPSAAGD